MLFVVFFFYLVVVLFFIVLNRFFDQFSNGFAIGKFLHRRSRVEFDRVVFVAYDQHEMAISEFGQFVAFFDQSMMTFAVRRLSFVSILDVFDGDLLSSSPPSVSFAIGLCLGLVCFWHY